MKVTAGKAETVIASVFPVEAAVVFPLKVIELMVKLVVPAEPKVGVLKVPLLVLPLTVMATSVAACALSPVKV